MILIGGGDGVMTQFDDEVDRRVLERTAQLEVVNRELEGFVSAVSHDLRAPLRSILGFTRIVIDEHGGELDADALACLDHVHGSATKMAGMLEGLLHLATTANQELAKSPVDLGRLAREILERFRRAEPAREVQCEIQEPLLALGDEALLAIALENLLGNAWKFTRHTPHARIGFAGALQEGRQVYVVSDNGVGFDASQSQRLFRPFQRLHHEEEFPGAGIGLATVRRIIARHGGSIRAEGRPGAGATFSFTL